MKIRVKKQHLLVTIVLFFVTTPTYLYTNFRIFSIFMAITQYALFVLMLYNFLRYRIRNTSAMFWIVSIMLMIEVISSFRNPYALPLEAIKLLIKQMGVLWFFDYEMRKDLELFIRIYSGYLSAYVCINLFTLFLFPDGMYQVGAYSSCYFLGYDNSHINVQLQAAALICVYSIWKRKRLSFGVWSILVIILLSNIITFSATSLLGFAVFLLGLFIILPTKRRKKYKIIKMPSPLISFLGIAIVSTLFIGDSAFGGLKDSILSFFGKDNTLSARTLIWENSVFQILKEPIWGYGYEAGEVISSKLVALMGQSGWGNSPHNFYLTILYTGGSILLVVIAIAFILLYKQYINAINTADKLVIGIWILAFLIMGITESHYDSYLRIMLIITYHILNHRNKRKLQMFSSVKMIKYR